VESFNRKILLAAHKAQNYPQLYGDIVNVTRRHNVTTQFSNIIGFPEDTEAGIEEHLETLIRLGPDMASFYILTPIPGTQQYDEFLADGRIYEKNLDRFDATCPTWHHDRLSPDQLTDLLFDCYRRFYTASHYAERALRNLKQSCSLATVIEILQFTVSNVFSRYSAFRRMHPMSGGVGRVVRDHVDDYLPLRIKTFGFDLVPLPKSLQLSAEELVLNAVGR
jgi:radical SAM superfamily enzyme YgiQ (UPF0313 family)